MTATKVTRVVGRDLRGRREVRKEQQQAISRLQLLDAAEEVFGRKGFHETTLKEIAEMAEFSVGSVYSFFENKDDLFRQIFLRRGEEFMPEMRDLLAAKRKPLEQLHDLVEYQIGFFRRHPQFARLFLTFSSPTQQSPNRLADELVVGNFEESMALQADLFSGVRAKQLIAGDTWVLARLLSGLVAAFQALDPLVVSDEPGQPERLTLTEFHAIVQRTFAL